MPRQRTRVLAAWAVCAAAVTLSTVPAYAEPTRLLVLSDFDTLEMGTSNDIVVLASRSAIEDANLFAAVRESFAERGVTSVELVPDLPPAELALLHEHARLAALATRSGLELVRSGESLWEPLRAEFGQSVGPGLAFLRERTGAEALLVVSGTRYRQSRERVVLHSVLSAASFAFTPIWFLPTLGSRDARVQIALIDLESGTLLWANEDPDTDEEPAEADAAHVMIRRLLSEYPRGPVAGRVATP